jgi:hypothetical protein
MSDKHRKFNTKEQTYSERSLNIVLYIGTKNRAADHRVAVVASFPERREEKAKRRKCKFVKKSPSFFDVKITEQQANATRSHIPQADMQQLRGDGEMGNFNFSRNRKTSKSSNRINQPQS